jgi:hypothetical protein
MSLAAEHLIKDKDCKPVLYSPSHDIGNSVDVRRIFLEKDGGRPSLEIVYKLGASLDKEKTEKLLQLNEQFPEYFREKTRFSIDTKTKELNIRIFGVPASVETLENLAKIDGIVGFVTREPGAYEELGDAIKKFNSTRPDYMKLLKTTNG